jgi:hypothetical protein
MIEFLKEKWGLWRRGEKRIAPGRGRVFAKKDGTITELEPPPKHEPTVTITATVIRNGEVVEVHKATGVTHGISSH